MATWLGNNVIVSSNKYARIRIESQIAAQEAGNNRTLINWQCYVDFIGCDAQLDNGFVGWWGGALYDNPGRVYNYAGNFNNHTVGMGSGQFWVGHDVNGNGSYGMNADVAVYQSGTSAASGSTGLPRLGWPPSFHSMLADTIKPTSARLRAELSSVGRGTSATLEMFYRLQGTAPWISLGAQGDAAGYNNWTAAGLKPGKVYEYICNCTNNNGDFNQTGVQSFKTQPVSGMIAVMKGML